MLTGTAKDISHKTKSPFFSFSFSAARCWGGECSDELGDSERSPQRTGGEGRRSSERGRSVGAAEGPEESEGQNSAQWINLGPDQQLPPRSQTGQRNKHVVLRTCIRTVAMSCLRHSSSKFIHTLLLCVCPAGGAAPVRPCEPLTWFCWFTWTDWDWAAAIQRGTAADPESISNYFSTEDRNLHGRRPQCTTHSNTRQRI